MTNCPMCGAEVDDLDAHKAEAHLGAEDSVEEGEEGTELGDETEEGSEDPEGT